MATKRAREIPPTVDDILHYSRIVMLNDPFKEIAPKEEDRHFRALFGCSPDVSLILWYKLLRNDLVPDKGTILHMLWTLMYCKIYPKWTTMKKLTSADPKTLRHWIGLFRDSIALLECSVIRWSKRKKGDQLNDCLVSVDCVDFPIPHAGRRFHTHKWKFHSALRYEIAVSIIHGECVWINGPYEAGLWNDIMIFRNALLHELEDGERVESDNGLRGVSPQYAKCPLSIGNLVECEDMQQKVRSRHETINKRFKQWRIMKNIYMGSIEHHGGFFRTVAIVTQLCIEHGEPLFSIAYEDPHFDDDSYFQEPASNNNDSENEE
ncbi:hypothetical protein IV203_029128 [Nitzschia inconspicua]|uniref:DDE Tnp4 domain-containing protein n=1 Tax=Nitzschia inconspicua TaxID=303405 RepID=A0A9K3LQ48_9STRA|nr:hypothetical protein IV203_029128 [Nitzschia inconspicua]